jgi:predicted DNA-binding transcriptional regulator AlpA
MTLTEVRKLPAAIDVTTAAQVLGISRATAYEAISSGEFPAQVITVNRRLVVLTSTLLAVLEGSGTREGA